MDVITTNQFPIGLPWLEICIFFGSTILLITVFNYIVLSPDEERPALFKVPIPEQCSLDWKGEVLEEPSIKVAPLSVQMRNCLEESMGRTVKIY